jgi:hypothetical protein
MVKPGQYGAPEGTKPAVLPLNGGKLQVTQADQQSSAGSIKPELQTCGKVICADKKVAISVKMKNKCSDFLRMF